MRSLKLFLDGLYDVYHQPSFLDSDPLEFAHRFDDPWDREAVALLGALLAYGNVVQIRRSVSDLLDRFAAQGHSPSDWVRQLGSVDGLKEARRGLRGFVHRFHVDGDVLLLLRLLEESWAKHGSLGSHFLSYLEPGAPTMETALADLLRDWKSSAARLDPTRAKTPAFRHFLSSPADRSCCKRWCMFLRWMGRGPEDGLDLGLWLEKSPLRTTFPPGRALSSAQLVMPLDTHTGRISQALGLTRRKSLNWKAALEVTRALGECDPTDPTRYDFALCRLGMLEVRKWKRKS